MALAATATIADEALQGRSMDGFAIDTLPFGVCVIDAAYRLVCFNRLFPKALRIAPESMRLHAALPGLVDEMTANGTLAADVAELLLSLLLQCQATRRNQSGHLPRAQQAEVLLHCNPLPSDGYMFVVGCLAEPANFESATQIERLNEALLNLPHGVCMYGPDERLIICNSQYISAYALDPQMVRPGVSYRDILAHSIARGNQPGMSVEEYYSKRLQENLDHALTAAHSTLWNDRTMRITSRPLQDGGWVSVHEDVTEQLEANRQIAHLAHHDALTDLPNRHSFHAKFSDALGRASARGHRSAVLYMDLDRFKEANDTFGHTVGDKLLINVAARFKNAVRQEDLVVRLGGDEFLIVQHGASRAISEILAQRLIESMNESFDIDGCIVEIGLSIGIAMAPEDGDSADVLLRHADQALYRAKSGGRGGYSFFSGDLIKDSIG